MKMYTTILTIEHCTASLSYNDELDLENTLMEIFKVPETDGDGMLNEMNIEYISEDE